MWRASPTLASIMMWPLLISGIFCLAAPFYQDSCGLLQQSLIRLGDQFAFAQEWCPAEYYYRDAASLGADAILNNKLGEAGANCANATPTPSAFISDTVTITNTQPITNP
ncbi:MAG: hypothetical protein M5U34_41965 [Chloroflexi bacterium]|nr:hypothetical protein [Chloroflexota bacterium]